jgi:hypothetical protein
MELPTTQLLVFRFGSATTFEGGLLGALERIETGMALRVLDVLFLRRTEEGELEVLSSSGDAAGGLASSVLDFRLDAESRRTASARALEADDRIVSLGEALAPGHSLAAVLLEHRWIEALGDAVERMGGEAADVEFVGAETLGEVMPKLRGAVGLTPTG